MKKYSSEENAEKAIFVSRNADRRINLIMDIPKNKNSRTSPKPTMKLTKHAPEPLEELNLHIKMKEKFDDLYRKIKRMSSKNPEELKTTFEKRYLVNPSDDMGLKKPITYLEGMKNELVRMRSKSGWEDILEHSLELQKNLQINTLPTPVKDESKRDLQVKMMRGTRYHNKPLLTPIKKSNLSNNVKDYLSVEKIKVRQIQESLLKSNHQKSKELQKIEQPDKKKLKSNKTMREIVVLSCTTYQKKQKIDSPKKSKNKKFVPPFEMFYYRDLIWRVGFSNELLIKAPTEYEQKIKVFVGKGNNNKLIRKIISRRSWYQVTEKAQEAQVIWTQTKIGWIFLSQKHGKRQLQNGEERENSYEKNSIWSSNEQKKFKEYSIQYQAMEEKMNQKMKFRNKAFKIDSADLSKVRIHNHLINNYIIGNKKALFQTMKQYYKLVQKNVFDYLPLTFHICNGLQDDEYLKFLQSFYALNKETKKQDSKVKYNAWILKPGENTNRGQGITVCLNLQSIKTILKAKAKHQDGTKKTYILQKYIEKPFLYKKRKFDLRHFIMINCSNGIVKGYWFKDGYARTTSSEYTLKQNGENVHLTNDAVQQQLPDYGKYQKGNKITYEELNDYMLKVNKNFDFWKQIYPKMKEIAVDVIRASANNLDPQRRSNNFQVFGLDFMFDQDLNLWLIEVNSNPCLEISCPLLVGIIPTLIQNTFQIAVDPMYPPPLGFCPKGGLLKENVVEDMKYELVYDERWEMKNDSGAGLLNDEKLMKEEEDLFDDDGEDCLDI